LAILGCSVILGVLVISIFPPQSKATDIGDCEGHLNPACNWPDECGPNSFHCPAPGTYYYVDYEGTGESCNICIKWDGCVFSCMPD